MLNQAEISKHVTLKLSDKKFFFRQIIPSDKVFIQRGFRELSAKSRYLRFFAHQNELSTDQLKFFTELDGINHVAWGVVDVTNFEVNPAGIGRFIRMKDNPEIAEVGITIVDAYHRMGLARAMVAILNIVGYQLGIRTFRYYVLPENVDILENLNPISHRRISEDKSVQMIDAKLIGHHTMVEENDETRKFVQLMKIIEEKIQL